MDPRDVPADILNQWSAVVQHILRALPYLRDDGSPPEILIGWPSELRLPGVATLRLVLTNGGFGIEIERQRVTTHIALADEDVVATILEELDLVMRRQASGATDDRRTQDAEMVDMLRGTGWLPAHSLPGRGVHFDNGTGTAGGDLRRTECGRSPASAVFAVQVRVTNLNYHAALTLLDSIRRGIPSPDVPRLVDFGGTEEGCAVHCAG